MSSKPRDQRLAILRQLGQESEEITLSELLDKLELDYTDRTVRRWLKQLIAEGLLIKSGHTKNAKYMVVKGKIGGQNQSGQAQISSCFGTKSLRALEQLKRPLFERQPVAYNDDWFESYKPNSSFYLSKTLREQLQNAGRRASEQDPAGTYAHQIFNRLLIDLAYNSSRLEGNTYSLIDTERLLLHGDSAEGKLEEEKVMILNHKEAIRYLVDNASRITLSQQVLCTIHYLLADGLVESKYAGKVRDHGVHIGGSTYMPFEDPRRLSFQLTKVSEKAALIDEPFEQSLFLLVHLSYLQAFTDVNKRTARLSANIPLITKNFVPLSFNNTEVDDYMSAMIAIYELQDVEPLIDLYVYSYMRTCAAYDSTVKAMGFDEARVRYRYERRALIRDSIIRGLVGDTLNTYIQSEAVKMIPEESRQAFIEDVKEDLELMDESRLAGLGVTLDQLEAWVKARELT